jgi:hypothetical protein
MCKVIEWVGMDIEALKREIDDRKSEMESVTKRESE